MLIVKEKVLYKAFGQLILSEISLPELSRLGDNLVTADVEIKIADLSKKWLEVSGKPYDFVISENQVMFQVPNVAVFLIQDGKFIYVSPFTGADEALIRLFILGTCMGAILLEKKIFPLHGSAIAIDGKAYAIVGESGAGKSTLASAFLSQGYKLLSDDVIAVTPSYGEKIPIVCPSYPQQKLWEDSLKIFGMGTDDYQSIYGREKKYCIPILSQFSTSSLPLAGVFELVKSENKGIKIRKIEKLARFHTLFCHTYRNFFIRKLGLMNWHFQVSSNILDKIDMYQLHRPFLDGDTSQLVSVILNTINKGE